MITCSQNSTILSSGNTIRRIILNLPVWHRLRPAKVSRRYRGCRPLQILNPFAGKNRNTVVVWYKYPIIDQDPCQRMPSSTPPPSAKAEPKYGSCLCKAVRYSVTGDPISNHICHCTHCKKVTGSAFICGTVSLKGRCATAGNGNHYIL